MSLLAHHGVMLEGAALAFPLSDLFAASEQGLWYQLADTATLSQDSAGGTPITASGQTLGRINDKSGNDAHATQATAAARPAYLSPPARMRSDFSNDVLATTLPAFNGEVWVNTPYGHYKSERRASTSTSHRLPLNDATEIIIREGTLTPQQRDGIAAYYGTDRKHSIFLSPDTTVYWYFTGDDPASVITYIGANGATYQTTAQRATVNVSTYGLTAPVAVVVESNVIGAGLTDLWYNANQLTGSIPNLSNNTALKTFWCNSNRLTGSIPDLSSNTALTVVSCHTNQLTGSIPNLSNNTALKTFYCHSNQLTGSIPSLASNTALEVFNCNSNQLTGSIPSLASNTALILFYCETNQLTGSIPSLSNNTAMTSFYCHSNQLTGVAAGFAVAPSLGDFRAQSNNLTAAAVNAILAAFVAANRTTGTRTLNLGGAGNAAPTGQGLTDKATLQSRGWTVTTN